MKLEGTTMRIINSKTVVILMFTAFAATLLARMPLEFQRGRRALEERRYDDALRDFETSLKQRGVTEQETARIHRAMAQAYIGMKDWDSASEQLKLVLAKTQGGRAKEDAEELLRIITAPEDPNVKVVNLGPAVNSRYEELSPVISPDGKTIYFIVDGSPHGFGKQDIYFSRKGEDGEWRPSENIGQPLNTEGHDGILSISPDGTSALLGGKYLPGGRKGNGHSMAFMKGGKWRDPEDVVIHDYYNDNLLTSAFLSTSGKYLFLALERKEGYGDLDIYISFKNTDGSWSAPLNLGSTVNTSGTDGTPFLATDEKTLYFSSNGHVGLGSQDMYKTERLDDTWTNWSKPENLGKQVNSAGWDAYYTIPAQGDIAYFVSSAKGSIGMSDIWMITLPQTARPGAVVTVSGRVMTPDSIPLGADISWEKLATGENMGTAKSNDVTGEYMIVLPVGEAYGYVAEKANHLPASENLDLTTAEAYAEIRHDIILTPIKRGAQTVLRNIFFDFDEATLRQESIGELTRLKELLADSPKLIVEIAGHTDSVGTAAYNIKLSTERAQSVASWLVENGIAESRMKVKGYGESQPIADNATEEGRQKNRRVVFEILDL